MQPPHVMIQQTCIPHYRQRLFQILTQERSLRFTCVADLGWFGPYLQVLDKNSRHDIRVRSAKTWRIPLLFRKYLTFQPGAILYAIRTRPIALIAEGSVYSLTAWILAIYGRLFGMRVLFWGHGIRKFEHGPKWLLRRLFYRLAAGHLLYSNYAKDLLVQAGLNPEVLHVVHNSLDYDQQERIDQQISQHDIKSWRTSLNVADSEGLVIFTGRLQPEKRLDLLIRAIGQLRRHGHAVHAAFIGDGSEKSVLVGIASDEGITKQVHFLGPVYDERQIGLYLAASDLAVIPSAAGLSIMHAMAFGTPVLIHDDVTQHGPEWEAVQEGITGFYYRCNDVADMTAKISEAIFPFPKKQAMAEACRTVIRERYNPRLHAEKIIRGVTRSVCR